MANWTPGGFIGQLFQTLGKHLPPPPGAPSPAAWGTRERLEQLFAHGASAIDTTPRHFAFRYRSAEHFLDVFRTFYGPLLKAFAALDAEGRERLHADLLALIARHNRATDGTMVVASEYLEVVVTRR